MQRCFGRWTRLSEKILGIGKFALVGQGAQVALLSKEIGMIRFEILLPLLDLFRDQRAHFLPGGRFQLKIAEFAHLVLSFDVAFDLSDGTPQQCFTRLRHALPVNIANPVIQFRLIRRLGGREKERAVLEREQLVSTDLKTKCVPASRR